MTADPRAEDARIVRADAVIYCAGFDNTNEKENSDRTFAPVSYTHLDVYKRQEQRRREFGVVDGVGVVLTFDRHAVVVVPKRG